MSPQSGDTTFRMSTRNDFFTVPDVTVPSQGTAWLMVALLALCTAESVRRYLAQRPTPLWLASLFAVLAMIGFLCWAAAGGTVPMVGLLGGSLTLAVPLVFGALGGVLGERAGVVNIAIDGQLLAGAFAAALVGSVTGSVWGGLFGALVAGALVALLLGLFAITYYVDQVIVGVVLNVLVIGITSFMFQQVLAPNAADLNAPPRLSAYAIPVLSEIPLIGPVFFRQSPLVYLLYVAVAVVTWTLYRTKWGLRVRAVGEHPKAADTVGINVNRTRYRTVLLAGAIVGIGGRVLHDGLRAGVQPGDDRRCRLHRPGRRDLRQVGPDPGHAGRAAVRLRLQPAGRAVGARLPGAQPVHADAALRRDHLRRGRPGGAVEATGRRRTALHQDLSARRAGRSAALQAGDGGLGEHPGGDRRRPLVDGQVALVQVVGRTAGGAGPEPAHRARDPLDVPAEVLAAQALGGRDLAVVAEHAPYGGAEQLGRARAR